jgi:cytochrome oxidase assembly protein ShyY1
MNRLRALLVLLLGLTLAAGMVVAGQWQLQVYQRQGAEAAARRAAEPPVPLTEAAPVGAPVRDGYGRTVTFRGSYEAAHQVLVPVADRTDAYRVVTLLRQDDGSAVAVVRGVVTETAAAPPPPAGPQIQSGILLPSEQPVAPPGRPEALGSVRVPQLAQRWPGPLIEGFVTLAGAEVIAQGLEPAMVALPEGRGRLRNAAYALQWWLFAAFTAVMAVRIGRDVARTPPSQPHPPLHSPSHDV